MDTHSLRSHKYDFGLPLDTSELSQEEFLARLSSSEKSTLKDLSSSFLSQQFRPHFIGALAIGSSTYSDEDYDDLLEYFRSKGLSDSDTVLEKTSFANDYFLSLLTNSSSYDLFKESILKANEDDFGTLPLPLFSEQDFNSFRKHAQPDYEVKKSVGDILSRKGEDIDILLGFDGLQLHDSKSFLELLCNHLDRNFGSPEYSFLSSHSYFAHPTTSQVYRIKAVSSNSQLTYRIPTADRSLHVYISHKHIADAIRECSIEDYSFTRLFRRSIIHPFVKKL